MLKEEYLEKVHFVSSYQTILLSTQNTFHRGISCSQGVQSY